MSDVPQGSGTIVINKLFRWNPKQCFRCEKIGVGFSGVAYGEWNWFCEEHRVEAERLMWGD